MYVRWHCVKNSEFLLVDKEPVGELQLARDIRMLVFSDSPLTSGNTQSSHLPSSTTELV